jgi:eukaryotic-like serine/threonine-protein kinase
MDPALEKMLFTAAAGFTRPEERQRFLEFVARVGPELRKELEELLVLQDSAESFFDLQPEMPSPAHAVAGKEGVGGMIGRYRLIERLGEGGCGVVYLAEQHEPVRRKVALKIVRLGMDTENVIARFATERQALALMDHPNIARVLDAGATASGRPYFVMELVDGEPITDFCEAGHLEIRPRLELFVKVCQAIQHAHQKGVIHRDIKPTNVLVRRHDGSTEPKVIDFGIAKATAGSSAVDANFTVFDQFLGTPAYMSPEQAAGGVDVDTRSDIYSLGALLYELIAGRPPFDPKRFKDAGPEETRRILREEEPPLPSSSGTGAGRAGDLDWIVLKAMAKERKRRYDTASGLAVDVLRCLHDEPVSARPPSSGYRLGKLVRRNKVVFAAGAVAVVALLAGFGISTRLFFLEKAAREEQARLNRIAEEARITETGLREAAEFREQVAKAAVQLGRGNLEEADRLLASVPVERTPVSLEAADCYRRIAEWHVLAGRFVPAGARYSSAVHAFSTIDDSDSTSISFDLLPATSALCYTGNDDAYEEIREFAIQRFSGTRHPQVAEQVLKASLLKPATAEMRQALGPMAELVALSVDDPNGWVIRAPPLAAWFCFALGLKGFRDGDNELATLWLNRCLAYPENNEARTASVHFVLAMMESHRGNRIGARDLIELSREPVERVLQAPLALGGPGEPLWLDWINAKLLMDEALLLLGK